MANWTNFVAIDYQNRGGNFPNSNEADSITVYKGIARIDFKNTSEADAKFWTEGFAILRSLPVKTIETRQTGEFYNDWVQVTVKF